MVSKIDLGRVRREGKHILSYYGDKSVEAFPNWCEAAECWCPVAGREAVFTEQFVQPLSEDFSHLVPGLHSLQTLEEAHLTQLSLHFLHILASAGKSNDTRGTQ